MQCRQRLNALQSDKSSLKMKNNRKINQDEKLFLFFIEKIYNKEGFLFV
jgi:hypothetical protein